MERLYEKNRLQFLVDECNYEHRNQYELDSKFKESLFNLIVGVVSEHGVDIRWENPIRLPILNNEFINIKGLDAYCVYDDNDEIDYWGVDVIGSNDNINDFKELPDITLDALAYYVIEYVENEISLLGE
jgi:hypothetical protein